MAKGVFKHLLSGITESQAILLRSLEAETRTLTVEITKTYTLFNATITAADATTWQYVSWHLEKLKRDQERIRSLYAVELYSFAPNAPISDLFA